jgi:hypothetical protein
VIVVASWQSRLWIRVVIFVIFVAFVAIAS